MNKTQQSHWKEWFNITLNTLGVALLSFDHRFTLIWSVLSLAMGGARAEAFVRLAAVFLNVLVPAVLVGKASEECLAGHWTCNVSDPVLALLGRTLNREILISKISTIFYFKTPQSKRIFCFKFSIIIIVLLWVEMLRSLPCCSHYSNCEKSLVKIIKE